MVEQFMRRRTAVDDGRQNAQARGRRWGRSRRWVAITLSGLLAIASTVTGDASAATSPGGCLGPAQCRISGRSIDAAFTTVPVTGPLPSQAYTDTFVNGGTNVIMGNGKRSTAGWFWFDSVTYTLDAELDFEPTAEVIGSAIAPDVSVHIAPDLSSASAVGTVQVTSCTYDSTETENCASAPAESVAGTWAADGRRTTMTNTYHVSSTGSTFTGTFSGASRLATAAVSAAGVSLPGGPAFADIQDAKSATVSVCHSGC